MSKIVMGLAGRYEIYNENCIILQKFNENKELTNKFKIYNDADLIPHLLDHAMIKKIIDHEFPDIKHLNTNII
jgi:hypothetical protein